MASTVLTRSGPGLSLPGALRRWLLGAALLPVAAAAGGASTLQPKLALVAAAVLALVACVCLRPALAAYLLIAVTPLVAGIDRGTVVPLFRPSEALALLLGGALAVRGLFRLRTGALPRLRLDRLELSLLAIAVTSSITPLLCMAARQRQITSDDLQYALVMWKYLGVYAIVRLSVTTDGQVRRCLWLSVGAGCVVAVLAIFQSLGLFGVARLLGAYYSSYGNTAGFQSRGGSTVGLPAAAADLVILNLAIVSGMWLRERRHGVLLGGMAGLLVLGALSAGEFSSAIGLIIAVVCVAIVTASPRLLYVFIPAALVAWKILGPVIENRLSGFQSVSGLPVSWTTRLSNLQNYFWPKLFSDWNFLLGVRPSARVAVPSQITGYVWIESGYTWLLWGGGIPLLVSYLYLLNAAGRKAWRVARARADSRGVVGIAVFAAIAVNAVLMVFDMHLTYRGSAEALFAVFALLGPIGRTRTQRPAVGRVTERPLMAGTSCGNTTREDGL